MVFVCSCEKKLVVGRRAALMNPPKSSCPTRSAISHQGVTVNSSTRRNFRFLWRDECNNIGETYTSIQWFAWMIVRNPTSLHLLERNSAVAEKEDRIAFSSSDSSQSNAPNPFQSACPKTEGPALLVTFCSPSLDHLSPELLIFLPFEPEVCRNSTGRSWGSCLDPFSPNSDC